jgi:hypothetical protein
MPYPLKQLADRNVTLNRLHNGGFEMLPVSFKQYLYDVPVGQASNAVLVSWDREQDLKGGEIPDTFNQSLIPYWRVKCSTTSGAIVSYSPVDPKTGYRVWSRDGGHVLVVSFLQNCTVTIEQDIYPYTEFPLQYYSAAMSGYTVNGNVRCILYVDFGDKVHSLIYSYSGLCGLYRRQVGCTQAPGTIKKMTVRIELSGQVGESVGLSGLHLALGNYEVSLPYCPHFMDHEVPTGTIITWEGDSAPLGYDDLSEDRMLFAVLSDPKAIENLGQYADFTIYSEQEVPLTDNLGSVSHNCHFMSNPFFDYDPFRNSDEAYSANISYRYTDVAWGATRVRSIDFNDRGVFVNIVPGAPPVPAYWVRLPSITWCVELGFYCGHAGSWYSGGVPFGVIVQTPAPPAVCVPLSEAAELMLKEFVKTTKMVFGLPASAGRSGTGAHGEKQYMDNWQHEHKHKIFSEDTDILPVYRSFKICRKQ